MNLTQIAEQVLAFLEADGVLRSADLTQVEDVVLQQVRRIGAKAVELHLGGQKLGYEGAARPCPCGQVQRFVEYRPKVVATLLGTVPIRRAYYRCVHCGASALPYDTQVGLGDAQVSVGLAQGATLLGAQGPFAAASETLYQLTGQRLSARTVERLTEQVGAVVAAQEAAQAAAIADWRAPPAEVQPERLYVAVDGTLVHQEDGWHEAKCVTCYWDEPDGTRQARYTVRFAAAAVRRGGSWLSCGRWPVVAGWRRRKRWCCWATGRSGSGRTSAGCSRKRSASSTGITHGSTFGPAAGPGTARRRRRRRRGSKITKRCCGTGRCGRSATGYAGNTARPDRLRSAPLCTP